MTDYKWSVGATGTMMIRDTGTYVEFWLKAGSGTYNANLPWGYTVNGVTNNAMRFNFVSGGSWQRLGRWLVTYDQTVTFRLFNSGTSGLGSGETHSVFIDRVSIPTAPSLAVTANTAVSITVDSNSNGNGGAALLQWQLGYSTGSGGPTAYMDLSLASGTGVVTGLAKGTTYYLWARVRNSKGWSAWSPRVSRKTWIEPDPPSQVVISNITQTSVVAKFTDNGNGGTPILERQLAYGVVPDYAEKFMSSSGTSTVTGLSGGATYYFWARVRNAVGWSGWSIRAAVVLKAGAWVNVNNVWKPATVWVNVGGVWKVAAPYGKIAGLWKETR